MRITYRWMKEYLNFDISPSEMIERLIMIGHEVDSFVDLGLLDNPICIARVLKVEPHPDADKLTVCQVDAGGAEPVQVVCGAPNVREGIVTVLAHAGARLPGGLTLKKTKIRGVRSEGMLLALDEMGLGHDHSGIVELDETAPAVGEGYDLLIEVEITPNRPDCLSIFGLCRDLAASYGKEVYLHPVRLKETYESIRELVSINIKAPEDCPRYTARLIKNIEIKPSPAWIQRRLLSVGLRPINNVVDATNYLLFELGHPLHAFDYDKIRQKRVIVRMAEPEETIQTLDGTIVKLEAEKDLLIADAEGPIALAGVMGGYDSQVTAETKNILLESAFFKPSTIRLTSRRHALSTDASYRFERCADIAILPEALDRVTATILEWAGGELTRSMIDTMPRPPAQKTIMLRSPRACRFLGVELSKTVIADLLAALGFEMVRSEGDILVLSVPSYRSDVTCEEDLYEEIARIYGYNNVQSTLPSLPSEANRLNPVVALRRFLQDQFVSFGFNEAVNLSFYGETDLERLGIGLQGVLKLLNPMSREQSIMRPNLLPSLLRNLVHNQNYGNSDLWLFEIARTFHFGDMAAPCVEKETLALAMMGNPYSSWRDGAGREADFYDLKGCLELVLKRLGIPAVHFETGGPSFLHPGRCARILSHQTPIGWLGELGPQERMGCDLAKRPQLAQLDLDTLLPLLDSTRKFRDLSRFPTVERDMALLVSQDVPAGQIENTIRANAGDYLESLFLFDCYQGKQVPEGMKSLAFRAVYRHPERTLKEEEVTETHYRILEAIGLEYGASLRDS